MRMFRTLPVLFGFVLVTQTLPLIRFGGPMMKHVQENTAEMCYQYGWSELAFVSNFIPISKMCNPVNWFVSLDIQLYVASFLIMKLLVKSEKSAFLAMIAQMVIGCLASGLFSLYNNILPVLSFNLRDLDATVANYSLITNHTAHYIALYPIGMLIGYLIMQNKGVRKAGRLHGNLSPGSTDWFLPDVCC